MWIKVIDGVEVRCLKNNSSNKPFKYEMKIGEDDPLEEPGRLQSMGSQRIRHDRVTSTQHSVAMMLRWDEGSRTFHSLLG